MPQRNPNNLSFGAGAVAFRDSNGGNIGTANLVGGFEATPGGEVVSNEGGAMQFRQAARAARGTGELSLTINETPNFLDEILRGVKARVLPAVANSGTGERAFSAGTPVQVGGTPAALAAPTLTHRQPPVGSGDAAPGLIRGTIFINGASGGMVDVSVSCNYGVFDLGAHPVADDIHADELGFTLDINGTPGDGTSYAVPFESSHGAGVVFEPGPFSRNIDEHQLVIWSSTGGPQDDLYEWLYPRVFLSGGKDSTSDGSSNQGDGVEITATILIPDTGPVYRFTKLPRQSG